MGLGHLLQQAIKMILRMKHVQGNTDEEGGALPWDPMNLSLKPAHSVGAL